MFVNTERTPCPRPRTGATELVALAVCTLCLLVLCGGLVVAEWMGLS